VEKGWWRKKGERPIKGIGAASPRKGEGALTPPKTIIERSIRRCQQRKRLSTVEEKKKELCQEIGRADI